MKRRQLSQHFFLDEFTRSQFAERHGIPMDVAPGSEVERNLTHLSETVLQPLRNALGPVFISSGYRPKALNERIGGSPKSAHLHGLAADISVSGYSPLQVARWLANTGIAFDQVIHEFGRWVHVSVRPPTGIPRQQLLTAVKTKVGTAYVPGIHSVSEAVRRAG